MRFDLERVVVAALAWVAAMLAGWYRSVERREWIVSSWGFAKRVLPPLLNRPLLALTRLENRIARRLRLPVPRVRC